MASVATPNEYNEKTNASIVPDKNDLVRLKNEDIKKNNEKQSNEKRKKKIFFFSFLFILMKINTYLLLLKGKNYIFFYRGIFFNKN